MNTPMAKLFGASWATTALGYGMGALTELDLYFKTGGQLPTTPEGWVQMIAGILVAIFGRVTRQANVSSEQEGVNQRRTHNVQSTSTDQGLP